VFILGYPSQETAKKLAEDEKARIAAQVQSLVYFSIEENLIHRCMG
jgi:hypothetical protein